MEKCISDGGDCGIGGHCKECPQTGSVSDVERTVMRLVDNWEELKAVKPSETHYLEIEDGCGWIMNKETGEFDEYLSTHTFYGSQFKRSSQMLQSYGFNVEIANWDA